MRIGIVTIVDYTNYGNRLQNYALSWYLQNRMNCKVNTLVSITDKSFDNRHYSIWLKNQILRASIFIPKLAQKQFGLKAIRWANFRNWSTRIPTKRYYEHAELPDKLNDEYDIFFVGSDQVWNCNFPAFKEYDYFLKFADNSKKASLSASFGFDSIPSEKKRIYAEELKKFRYLSVRENAGKDIIGSLIGRDAAVLIDPVMMLDKKEWLKVSRKPKVDIQQKYVLKYYLGDNEKEDPISKWAEKNGYKVYELLDQSNADLYSSGPGEFLSLIEHASLICSDSFHCIAFSILFNKPFIVYSRKGMENYMSSRLETLLGKFKFENRWSDQVTEEAYLKCDYSEFAARLEKERKLFNDYVSHVIGSKKHKHEMPQLAEKKFCTGCSACASVCPAHCIEMLGDQNGFSYPEIIDSLSCLHCGQCERICPVLKGNELMHMPKAYAAFSNNDELRKQSSSGGIFSEMAEYILSQGGIVFGAAYDEHFNVIHTAVERKEELNKLRGAKYAESHLNGIFQSVLNELKNDRFVLFSGTPCQVAGLKAYLKKDYENLICIDFVCHGVPSPTAWQKYIKYRCEKDNEGIAPLSINLRSKETGWSRYTYSNEFVYKDHKYLCYSSENEFMQLFVGDYINRESCSNCLFKGYSRESDITIGDFWGIWDIEPNMDDNKGTSIVLLQSLKGSKLFKRIAGNLTIQEVSLSDASAQNPSMIRVSVAKESRNEMLENIRHNGFDEYCDKGK